MQYYVYNWYAYVLNLNLNLTLLQEDEDLEAIAGSVPQSEPYILAVGNSVEDLIQFAVIVTEQAIQFSVPSRT